MDLKKIITKLTNKSSTDTIHSNMPDDINEPVAYRRKPIDKKIKQKAVEEYNKRIKVKDILDKYGISRQTLYRELSRKNLADNAKQK